MTKEQWERDAKIAYGTKAYQRSFELYWDITAALRKDMTKKEISNMRAVKKAAWDAEEVKIS